MATYTYMGGPCDGQHRTTATPLADGTVVQCGGAGYQFNSGNPGALIWLDVGPAPGAGGSGALHTRAVGQAWAQLNRVLRKEIPQATRRSQRARARLRGLVR